MLIKKKKNRIMLFLFTSAIGSSVLLTSVVYSATADGSLAKITSTIGATDAELQPVNGNVNVHIAARDNNIDKIPKEELEKLEPLRKQEADVIPAPELPRSIENETTSKPEIEPGEIETTIEIAGRSVKAIVTGRPTFTPTQFDKEKGISNPSGYQNITVGKIVSVTVTKELREAVRENAINGDAGLFNDTPFKVVTQSFNEGESIETVGAILRHNKTTWENLVQRFGQLFDSPNVVKFLNSKAQAEYPQKIREFKTKEEKYAWLLANLDKTKFTRIGSRAEAYLKEGYALDPRNAFINEDGVIDSYAYSVPDKYNGVVSRVTRDNLIRRVFGYNSPYTRSPDDVRDGIYPGWEKQKLDLASDEVFKKYQISSNSGINIFKLKRKDEIDDPKLLKQGVVVEIDASNPEGYRRTKELVQKFKNDKIDITSYRIFNMGAADGGQKFKEILSELPENLSQLELFFSDRQTNTSSLIALENKKIKELSLYTSGNSLKESWSFNPLALKNTSFINTLDYNVSFEYGRNQNINTRITFDTIAFDEEDYNYKGNEFERINLGLRMAYYARNNEPFFQGKFGPGLEPDQKQGDNSYPTGLDFSRVSKIKSLRGLEFHDSQNSTNRSRIIKRLTLFNNGDAFEISTSELSQANLQHLDTTSPFERPKIFFSNGNFTKKIKISDTKLLSSSAQENLRKYFEFNEMLKSTQTIVVPSNAVELKKQLTGLGYKVETTSFKYS
ncbi:putative immunoglobulin-blocking virulence protein [Mycoplasma putrefaciens]|uniref:putative immunoglobulin-blocking virulence protein n=1 Tax=Mycoplasma putrefaciens TaxID=2123 RepID=UPI003DA324E2